MVEHAQLQVILCITGYILLDDITGFIFELAERRWTRDEARGTTASSATATASAATATMEWTRSAGSAWRTSRFGLNTGRHYYQNAYRLLACNV